MFITVITTCLYFAMLPTNEYAITAVAPNNAEISPSLSSKTKDRRKNSAKPTINRREYTSGFL